MVGKDCGVYFSARFSWTSPLWDRKVADVLVAATSYQFFRKSFCNLERAKPSPIKVTVLIFRVKNSTMKLSGVECFSTVREKTLS